MVRSVIGVVSIALGVLTSAGCAIHHVKYNPYVKCRIEPTEGATTISGNIDEAKTLLEQSRLPHHNRRQRYELELQAAAALFVQLGSDDYIALGEVYGGGNAYANQQTLGDALARKGARKGGNVVMVFSRGVQERPFVYSTPGYSTTNVYGSAYGSGNYVYGSATGHSTYYPGRTYAGIMRFPSANAMVFRHVPGMGKRRKAILALDDDRLGAALRTLESLLSDDDITLDYALAEWDRLVNTGDEG